MAKASWWTLLAGLAVLGPGCSGINTTQSISPLDFLLPGAGHFLQNTPPPAPGASNVLFAARTDAGPTLVP